MDRVEGEDQSGEPGAPQPQLAENEPQEQGVASVEQHVVQVVPEWRQAPQLILDPEGRVDQRVVLRNGPDLAPDPSQSRNRPQGQVVGHVIVVVPDVAALQRGEVGE